MHQPWPRPSTGIGRRARISQLACHHRLFCRVSAAQVFLLHSPAVGSSGRRPEQLLLGFCGTGLGTSPWAADRRCQLLCKTSLLPATAGYHLPFGGHLAAAGAQRLPGTSISDSSDLEFKPGSAARVPSFQGCLLCKVSGNPESLGGVLGYLLP